MPIFSTPFAVIFVIPGAPENILSGRLVTASGRTIELSPTASNIPAVRAVVFTPFITSGTVTSLLKPLYFVTTPLRSLSQYLSVEEKSEVYSFVIGSDILQPFLRANAVTFVVADMYMGDVYFT